MAISHKKDEQLTSLFAQFAELPIRKSEKTQPEETEDKYFKKDH